MLVENDSFLTELTKMYERNKASGTVWVTLKRSCLRRLPKRGEERPSADAILDPAGTEWVVLVRANDGKKKISTSVANKAGDKFNKSMTTIQKAYMGVTLVDPRRAYGGKHRMTTPRMVRITNRATPGSSEWQPYVMDGLRETAKKPKKERAAGSKKKA